jgi:hypothetical protein
MSIIVSLVGPIQYWWNTPDDPHKFDSFEAQEYRRWRQTLSDALVDQGHLVFRPHEAFKGTWDQRAQVFNDAMVQISDVVVVMGAYGIPSSGTDHEIRLAVSLGKHVISAPPGTDLEYILNAVNE